MIFSLSVSAALEWNDLKQSMKVSEVLRLACYSVSALSRLIVGWVSLLRSSLFISHPQFQRHILPLTLQINPPKNPKGPQTDKAAPQYLLRHAVFVCPRENNLCVCICMSINICVYVNKFRLNVKNYVLLIISLSIIIMYSENECLCFCLQIFFKKLNMLNANLK